MNKSIDKQIIWQKDRDHFIHPYTDFSVFKDEGSQIICEAEGVHISDADGNRLIDGIGGLWCVNIGHGRKEMAEAISDQVLKMDYFNPFGHTTNEPASLLAGKLAELSPGDLNHIFYACSGSAANDISIRLVHYYFNMLGKPKKKKIISRVDGYHGATYVAASLTGILGTKDGFDLVPDFIEHVSAANMYRRPEGMDESQYCDFLVQEFENRILQIGPEYVAAFIAEPLMGAGGVLVAPQGYHRRMWEVCQAHDVLYIADEVVTSFARLGSMFASEDVYGMTPDIINTAKGITSGYIPLSATLLSDKIYDVISQPQAEGGTLTLGFTYSGHPVACAAALKNIEIIERENICDHVNQLGPLFGEMLSELNSLSIVGDVRGSHLMWGIELVSDKQKKTGFPGSAEVAMRVFKRCMDKGVVVRPIGGNLLVLSPPLIISAEQCAEIVSALRESILEITQELTSEGLMSASS